MSREAARAAGAAPVAPDGRGCSALGYVQVFQPSGAQGSTRNWIEAGFLMHIQSTTPVICAFVRITSRASGASCRVWPLTSANTIGHDASDAVLDGHLLPLLSAPGGCSRVGCNLCVSKR